MIRTIQRKYARLRAIGVTRRLIPHLARRGWLAFTFAVRHVINLVVLWLYQVECGRRLRTLGLVDIDLFPGSQVKLGNDVTLLSDTHRYTLAQYGPVKLRTYTPDARIRLGNHVSLNGTVIACRSQTIDVGDGTIFAGNCVVMDSDFHRLWPPEERLNFPSNEFDAAVTIGKNCWFGLNVIVLKGAQVGDNVVIGAGSIVTGDVPANCVAAGMPAKVIRHLP